MSQPVTDTEHVTVNLDRIHAQYGRIQADLILRLSVAEQERDEARQESLALARALEQVAPAVEAEVAAQTDGQAPAPSGDGKPKGQQRGGGSRSGA